MQIKSILAVTLVGGLVFTSCSKLDGLTADNFTVTPSPLEAVGGQVPVTINGRFPEKWMKKKAVVSVTPVLRYAAGETVGQPATFQGEKVQGNNQEISYKVGGNYVMKNNFAYVPDMLQSELYLTFKARIGKKEVEVPEVLVANGVLSTSELLKRSVRSANPAIGEDAFQYAIAKSQQAQIKYLVNQARVRSSELETVPVQEFVEMLREIKADQKGFQLDNIEVSAYASPEGTLKFNTALAEKRQKSSAEYVQGQLEDIELDAYVDERYTAEDWDGFQELVQASNMQDKDVILRVLSMYQDPEQREREIRNLSVAFGELADEILPELRRARLTINYNIIGRSDDEIEAQYKADASKLSVEELLYFSTFEDGTAFRKDVYSTTVKLYPEDYRAYNNLATVAYAEGDYTLAKKYLEDALKKNPKSQEAHANLALLALVEGDLEQTQDHLSRATEAKNYHEILGNYNVAAGNYVAAAQCFPKTYTNSAALAKILNKEYADASKILSKVSQPDALTSYLKAITAVRSSQTVNALTYLKEAISKDASFKKRAAKDLEFITLFNDSDFQKLVK